MGRFKMILWVVLGFCAPVLLAVVLSPMLFTHVGPLKQVLSSATSIGSQAGVSQSEGARGMLHERPIPEIDAERGGYIPLPDSEQIGFSEHAIIVMSIEFTLPELPKPGSRRRLILKYDSETLPYPGWALAIKQFRTSLRPEVYWQGVAGAGGWHTFGEYGFRIGLPYRLTLLAEPGEFLSLYVSPLSAESLSEDPAQHVGGMPLLSASLPTSRQAVFVVSPSSSDRVQRAVVHSITLAELEVLPEKSVIDRLLSKGREAILDVAGENNILLSYGLGVEDARKP